MHYLWTQDCDKHWLGEEEYEDCGDGNRTVMGIGQSNMAVMGTGYRNRKVTQV